MSKRKHIQTFDYTQLQQQKQDLVHCNNSFGMLLSSLESYLIKCNYNLSVMFGHYNHFNDISWKTKSEIKSQLYFDLLGYKIQKSAYFKKYQEVHQPDYPPISEISKIVKQWKKKAEKEDDKKLCDEIIDLIEDKNVKPISYYQQLIESTNSPSHSDPIQSLTLANKIHDIMDKRDAQINNEIQRNPNAQFGLEIGKQPGSSEFSHLPKNLNVINNDPQQKIIKDNIINQINIIIKILDNYYNSGRLESNSLMKNIKDAEIIINEYIMKYKNLNFIFQKFNIDNILKRLTYKTGNGLEYAKAFFTKIYNSPMI
jgi:hypothetical protein